MALGLIDPDMAKKKSGADAVDIHFYHISLRKSFLLPSSTSKFRMTFNPPQRSTEFFSGKVYVYLYLYISGSGATQKVGGGGGGG